MKNSKDTRETRTPDANRDPISGAPGAHPIGVGVGATGGGTAGAAIGSVAGPIGTAVGAAVGAVAGGLAGKGAAEAVNPTREEEFWKANYASRPYVARGASYDMYRPAYQYGWESYMRYQGRRFDEVENDLRRDWEKSPHAKSQTWDKAKLAVKDAWHRIERTLPGDADHDGR
jgi:hypothetical protein